MPDPDSAHIDPATTAEDRRDAAAPHDADRPPTAQEEEAAERNDLDPEVASAYEDAIERGANVKGEGEITP